MKINKLKTTILLACLVVSIFFVVMPIPETKASYSYTHTFYSTGYDGEILKSATTYLASHNATLGASIDSTSADIQIGQKYLAGTYYIYRGFLYFDTSPIPDDAIVTAANVSLNCSNIETNYFNLVVQDGQPLYPHTPLTLADFYSEHYSGMGGNVSTSSLIANDYVNLTLSSTGLEWINLEDVTELAFLSDQDINYTSPVNDATINIYSVEQGQNGGPILYITYSMDYRYTLNIHGAFNEDGSNNLDGLNCSVTRPNQVSDVFLINGTHTTYAQTDTRLLISIDVGGNLTRVYYLRYNQWYEDVYIFYPDEFFATYYITLLDTIGIQNGYLESILNVNGTDRVIERQRVDVVNEIPFVLSWGTSYRFRLICDRGTYIWESLIAGVDTSIAFTVTPLTFPAEATKIENITMSAERTNGLTIDFTYVDSEELTNWVYIAIYEYATNSLEYSTNNTGNSHSITWDSAIPSYDYTVYVEINHIEEGILSWQFSCSSEITGDNPWDFSWMGDWGPFDSTQLIGAFLVLCVFGVFSRGSVDIGIMATLLTAGLLNLLGWLQIPWDYFTIIFAIGILVVVSLNRSRIFGGS